MKILLVDDEELQLSRLKGECEKVIVGAEFYAYSNPLKVVEDSKKIKFDIAFLDIEMPGINGIQLAKKLKSTNSQIKIIFVTAFNDYALEAYRLHASGYVTKPVSESKIKEEVEELKNTIDLRATKKLQVKCFGNFEVFHDGEIVKFSYQKSKEVFAYLVDREGSSANINELNAVMWEEDHKSYLRNLIADIQQTLKSIGCSDVFIKQRNGYSIDTSKIDCDAYEYKNNNPDAVRMYRGEYMIQYSWAYFKDEY
ncbi:MAG: response regulator [Bacilli bacterium]|nr:response regulator [Bacilli bacterium]